jgi:hypothetical protein
MHLLLDAFSTDAYDNTLHHLLFMGAFFIVIIVVVIFWLRRS